MTIIPEEGGKIKILLTAEDTSAMGISFKTINCKDPDTRLLLRAVYKMAKLRSGEDYNSRRLLIEAYPYINGGGILYFTPLEENRGRKRLKLKTLKPTSDRLNYVFPEGSCLLKAIELLYQNEHTRPLYSELYTVDDVFLLTIHSLPDLSVLHEIKEFSRDFFTGRQAEKYTGEHGKVLTGKNAIREIGEKITGF